MALRRPLVLLPGGHVGELPVGDVTPTPTPVETVDPWTYIVLPSNVSVNTTALADVTGMSFYGQPSTRYEVELIGALQTPANTTGAALALDIPSGTIIGQGFIQLTVATAGAWEQVADNNTTGTTTGVRAALANTPFQARWLLITDTTGGTIQLRLRSEVAASAVTLQAQLTVMKFRIAARQSTSPVIAPVTQTQYDALVSPDPTVLYVIVDSVTGNPNYKWVELTSAEYAALTPKDPETLYVVND